MKKIFITILIIALTALPAYGQTIGGWSGGGSGDATGVGDCSTGACLDGSSDGGTYIRLYDGTSAYTGITAGVRTLTLAPSNANAESLLITFGDNDNTLTLGSGTGASVSINGNAGTVTNFTGTTALTNQGGAGILSWPAAGATLTIPTGGGTLGTAAFTAATAYQAADADLATIAAYASIANLTGLAGATANNNGLFGYKTVGGYDFYTTHTHDNSAGQFYDSVDSTKIVKVDPVGMTTGKTLTTKYTFDQSTTLEVKNTGLSADSKTITIDWACTDNCTITGPTATGTLQTVKAEKIASFSWDGGGSAVATAGSKRCTLIPVAYTVTGYSMVVDQDPGAGTTILNLDKDAIGDGTTLATTDMDGTAHAYPPTMPDNKVAVNDTTITGWTTAVSANDMICAAVATNAVATWITLSIYGTK